MPTESKNETLEGIGTQLSTILLSNKTAAGLNVHSVQIDEFFDSTSNEPINDSVLHLEHFHSCPYRSNFGPRQPQKIAFYEQKPELGSQLCDAITLEDFQKAKLALNQACEATVQQKQAEEYTQQFVGLRKCPMMNMDSTEVFTQYKNEYLQSIKELVTEDEIKEWEMVEKGWENYRIGQFGYFGDFSSNNDDMNEYNREKALEAYGAGNNEEAIYEFNKTSIGKMDGEEVICYLGALASENYFSDVDEKLKQISNEFALYFKLFCSGKYSECMSVCDKLLESDGTDKLHKYYLNMKACALAKLENYEEALKCTDKCIELDGSISKFHANKAILLSKCGKSNHQFMECLEKAFSLAPDHLKSPLHEIERVINQI